jgi:hypothetical protein
MAFAATPDKGLTFTGSWCDNCGGFVRETPSGVWVHLEGLGAKECDPKQVAVHRWTMWHLHDKHPELYPEPDFPRLDGRP